MSTAVVPGVTEPVDSQEVVRDKAGVERTTNLLAECQKKLRAFNERLLSTKGALNELTDAWVPPDVVKRKNLAADFLAQKKRYRPVIVAAEQLARYASGLMENARLPQIDKIELQLRNAELEAELIEARHLIG